MFCSSAGGSGRVSGYNKLSQFWNYTTVSRGRLMGRSRDKVLCGRSPVPICRVLSILVWCLSRSPNCGLKSEVERGLWFGEGVHRIFGRRNSRTSRATWPQNIKVDVVVGDAPKVDGA